MTDDGVSAVRSDLDTMVRNIWWVICKTTEWSHPRTDEKIRVFEHKKLDMKLERCFDCYPFARYQYVISGRNWNGVLSLASRQSDMPLEEVNGVTYFLQCMPVIEGDIEAARRDLMHALLIG